MTTNLTNDAVPESAARLSEDTLLLEPGGVAVPTERSAPASPSVSPRVV